MKFLGIDGCKGGWFCIVLADKNSTWEINIFNTLPAVFDYYKNITIALIDIPIGLPEKIKRSCDTEVRKNLTKIRSSSVFPVPSRKAAYAENYQKACNINLKDLGVKISKQAWNLCKKIKETDQLVQKNPYVKKVLKEAHPELNFLGWNSGKPMQHYKKTSKGRAERLSLLNKYLKVSEDIYTESIKKFQRKDLLADDIIDAMILSLSAQNYLSITSLPKIPEYDSRGLKMEIVYCNK